MRRPKAILIVLLASGILLLGAPDVLANARTDQMLKLLKKKPRKMTVETWQEERREAARELGRIKNRRAVPILLSIVAKERFDVILEIAIDALGEIGDKRAVGPLKKLLNDPSLDAYVRDAVAGALRKLGTDTRPISSTPGKKPGAKHSSKPTRKPNVDKPSSVTDPGAKANQNRLDMATRLAEKQRPFGKLAALDLELDADVIAFSDRFEIIAGAANVRWDDRAGEINTAFALRSRFWKQVEKKAYGYTIDGSADLSFRLLSPRDVDATWDLANSLQVTPEIRFYPFKRDVPLLSGQLTASMGYGLNYGSHPTILDRRFSMGGNLSAAVGPAFGRIYDVGGRLRLKRFEFALKKAGMLSGPIDLGVATDLLHAWYQLRNEIGSFKHLGHSMEILSRANLLKKDTIDPATMYRLIRTLEDPQLDYRPSGMLFRLGYGYGRALIMEADDLNQGFLYATAQYNLQLTTFRAFEAGLKFYYQMLGEPDTIGLSLQAGYTHFLYNKEWDPLGAITATLSGGLSRQALPPFVETVDGEEVTTDGAMGYRVMAGGSYSRFFNRGTKIVAAAQVGIDTGNPLVMFTLEAQYGLAYGSLAPAE